MALNNTIATTPVIGIKLNDEWYIRDKSLIESLRSSERAIYAVDDPGFHTLMIFDQKKISVETSLNSIYTTLFIIFLLVVRTIT